MTEDWVIRQKLSCKFAIVLSASWLAAGALLIVSNRGSNITVNANGISTSGLVTALFAAFAWIQFTLLFNGEADHTMGFEDYREYVCRGFGELPAGAILGMILILGLRRAMSRAT